MEMAYNMNILSVGEKDGTLTFYTGKAEFVNKKYLSLIYDKNIELIDASEAQIKEILDKIYNTSLGIYSSEEFTKRQIEEIIKTAISMKVSDIHFEPQKKYVNIRFRKDGNLFIYEKLKFKDYNNIIIRVKLLSNMDISDKLRAQDGKMIFYYSNNEDLDIRISTIPCVYGEKLVMRILYRDEELINLKKLNFTENQLKKIYGLLKLKHGIVIVNGPTGSGKSTTLYSMLKEVNKDDINISTIEDPVEFCIDGITQININEKIGLSFSSGLKHLLRQDPDIVMIGEIRDENTAKIAVRAAITGHKVFSTIHTNNPEEVFYRLLDMGVEKYLLMQAINGVISQRLVRLLCPKCKTRIRKEDIDYDINYFELNSTLYKAKGCEACNFTGYNGRTMISEILIVDKNFIKNLKDGKEFLYKKEEDILSSCKYLAEKGVVSVEDFFALKDGEGIINEL
ncbi:type IV pilus assembly protein PilB [Clostridium cavendishii DSM 21758]|uniref:Type IV pilus assembly protein PilB n=2 Tax=Clostridium TaxID=1485 RepID=A0A1M6KMM6_9CLOT|nr:type IV pilus assembly protein PilB [Clostridium cavendishii DSM 21758]